MLNTKLMWLSLSALFPLLLLSSVLSSVFSFTFHTTSFYFPAQNLVFFVFMLWWLVYCLIFRASYIFASSFFISSFLFLFFIFIVFFSLFLSLQYLQTYYKPLSSLPISCSYNFFLFSSLLAFSANNLISLYFVLEFLSFSLIGLMFLNSLLFHSEIVNSLI